MPADYSSTARALALPVSPPHSPIQKHQQPRWSHHRGNSSFSHHQAPSRQAGSSLRNRAITKMDTLGRATLRKFSPLQLALAAFAGLLALITTIVFLIYHQAFFAWLEPTAVKWKNLRGGWCILWAMTFMTAFPPMVGYSTCFTLAGFVYGLPEGYVCLRPFSQAILGRKLTNVLKLAHHCNSHCRWIDMLLLHIADNILRLRAQARCE